MAEHRTVTNNNIQSLYPTVLILSILLTGGFITASSLFNKHFKQYKSAKDIPQSVFRKEWLYGKVTSVGDGDNFHFFHTPSGILGGWGWLRSVPELQKVTIQPSKKATQSLSLWDKIFNSNVRSYKEHFMNLHVPVKGRRNLPTISVRLCGVDAPERSHFGKEAQPFSDEALNWLRYKILGKNVWIKPLSVDQYGRCVAKVQLWSWYKGWQNISIEMLREGLGVVYEGKTGAEFDGDEKKFRYEETIAKKNKRGLWSQRKFETPGSFKKRI
ncbi:putative endonuclease YGL085W [Kluyveromyces marxianus]|uniref:Probable endonuclease LCL3 n=1 Tax=Kluyveromyces marxianus TaxID=4911 RepID=A0ABX6EZM2_KLUMA|nr:putative endonuclease YGL085W [Kluyveromyces marxianus]